MKSGDILGYEFMGARFGSDFNANPPAITVQIPLKGRQAEVIIKRYPPRAS